MGIGHDLTERLNKEMEREMAEVLMVDLLGRIDIFKVLRLSELRFVARHMVQVRTIPSSSLPLCLPSTICLPSTKNYLYLYLYLLLFAFLFSTTCRHRANTSALRQACQR